MARLPTLVAALAEQDDREPATLNVIARTVREAGHMQTVKRGRGSAEMTVRDASNLLIGANGADAVKDAAAAVPLYRTLRRRDPSPPEGRGGVLGRLDQAKCFGDALEELIRSAPELGSMFLDYVERAFTQFADRDDADDVWRWHAFHADVVGIDVKMTRPSPYAEVELWRSTPDGRVIDHRWQFIQREDLLTQGFYPQRRRDRKIQVRFGYSTLASLHAALHGAATDAAGHGMERPEAP